MGGNDKLNSNSKIGNARNSVNDVNLNNLKSYKVN